MNEEEADFRKRINFLIAYEIAAGMITTHKPSEPLLLGPDFAHVSNKMFDELEVIRNSIIRDLNALSVEDLQANFSYQGEAATDEWQRWAQKYRTEIRTKYSGLMDWYLLPFEGDTSLADFEYWTKAAYFTLDEALWLSVGLQPTGKFDGKMFGRAGNRKGEDSVTKFIVRRRELFVRELDGYSRRHTANVISEWIHRVELEVHPGFQRMLEKMLTRAVDNTPKSLERADPTATAERFENREKASLAKLIVTMAMEYYGYVPTEPRSPTPAELQGHAAKFGIDIDVDTIRKYLKLGASYLPKE